MSFGRSKFWVALLIVMLLLPTGAALAQARPQLPPGQEQAPIDDLYTALEDAAALLAAGDGPGAEAGLRVVVNDPGFGTLPDSAKFAAYFGLAGAISGQETDDAKRAEAFHYITLAGEVDPNLRSGIYWQYLTLIAVRADEDPAAVAAFTELASGYPELALAWHDNLVFSVLRISRELDDPDARLSLLEALWQMAFVPKDSLRSMESNWLTLMAAYVDEGETAAAGEIAQTLSEPRSVVVMTVDKRFAAYRPADPAAAHEKAFAAELSESRKAVEDEPDNLGRVNKLANTLRDMNRGTEALTLLQTSLDRIERAATGARVFEDQEDKLAWALNAKASLLLDAGQSEEAIETQRQAHEVALSYDKKEVSQGLNLAEMLVWLERPEEALLVLNEVDLDDASTYGRMSAEEIRVCANSQLGNDHEDGLAKLWAAASDAHQPLRIALLCVDDKQGLKKLVTDALADPEQRLGILVDLQVYDRSENAPRFYKAMVEVFDATMQEPDMKAEIGKYGTIETWNMGG